MKSNACLISSRCDGRRDANSATSDDFNALADSSRDPPRNTAFYSSGDAVSFLAIQNISARASAICLRANDSQKPSTGGPAYLRIARTNNSGEFLATYPLCHAITSSIFLIAFAT